MRFRSILNICRLLFIVITPVVLLILPATFFDSGRSICLSQLLLNMECPACGMTRACMHLIHFDLEEAYAYNMMSFVVFPLLAVVWVQWFLKELRLFKRYRAAFAASEATIAK